MFRCWGMISRSRCITINWHCLHVFYPIGSMYGIFTHIYWYHKNQPNVGRYAIHGFYGYEKWNKNGNLLNSRASNNFDSILCWCLDRTASTRCCVTWDDVFIRFYVCICIPWKSTLPCFIAWFRIFTTFQQRMDFFIKETPWNSIFLSGGKGF